MCAWAFVILLVHGRKRQRRCPVDPWPAWLDAKQSPADVWGWGVRRPAGWPGSTDSGTDPCETAPSSAPTGRSNRGKDVKTVKGMDLWLCNISKLFWLEPDLYMERLQIWPLMKTTAVIKTKRKKDKICMRDNSEWGGYLVVPGGVRCGSAEAPVERYYSPTQPPPVADLLYYVQGGPWEVKHTHKHTHKIDLICTGSFPNWVLYLLFHSLIQTNTTDLSCL